MAPTHRQSRAELYTKLIIALADFGMLLFVLYLHVVEDIIVDAWVIGLLLTILGSMLGQDILRDLQTGNM